jgi:SAM-dependent methyltransferase
VLRRALAVARVFAVAPVSVFRGAVVEIWRRRPWRRRSSPPGTVNLGDLRRLEPFSLDFGFDRGRPIDRGYIEEFLARHRRDVRGRVLEVGDDGYTRQFGGPAVVTHDVLHVDDGNARATLVGDLADGRDFPSNAFDCIILTQTLHLVFDLRAAVATLHRMLKAGGVLLVTVPGVSSIDRGEWGATWYWSLTPAALQRLLEERFGREGVAVSCQGNVLAATAFLYGLVDSELEREELESPDPHYPVIVAARAVKRTGPE